MCVAFRCALQAEVEVSCEEAVGLSVELWVKKVCRLHGLTCMHPQPPIMDSATQAAITCVCACVRVLHAPTYHQQVATFPMEAASQLCACVCMCMH